MLTVIAVSTFIGTFSLIVFLFNIPSVREYQHQSKLLDRVPNAKEIIDEEVIRKEIILSNHLGIHRFLSQFEFLSQMAVVLQQSKIPLKVVFFVFLSIVFLIGTPAVFVFFGFSILIGIVLGIILAIIPFLVLHFIRLQRVKRFETVFPEMIAMMKMALRSGQGVNSAFELIANDGDSPVREEIALMNTKISLGVNFEMALKGFAYRNNLPEVHFFVSSVLIQKASGGNLADVLETIENIIRERFAFKRELNVMSAQGKMSGMVLSLIPVGLAIVIFQANPDYIRFFVYTSIGHILTAVIIGLTFLGSLWLRKIVQVKM